MRIHLGDSCTPAPPRECIVLFPVLDSPAKHSSRDTTGLIFALRRDMSCFQDVGYAMGI